MPSETPLSPTDILTFTDTPTQTATLTLTPTETLTQAAEVTTEAEVTPEVTSERYMPTETPTAQTATETLTPSLTATSEKGLPLIYAENFDGDNDFPEWMRDIRHVLETSSSGRAMHFSGITRILPLVYDNIGDVALQARVAITNGAARLSVRHQAGGGYSVLLRSDGQIGLYRGEALLGTAAIPGFVLGEAYTLRLSVVGGDIAVTVEGTELLVFTDLTPLPAGAVFIGNDTPGVGDFFVDDLSLWGTFGEKAASINQSSGFNMSLLESSSAKIVFEHVGMIFTVNPDGSDLLRIASLNTNYSPVWRLDAERIAYFSDLNAITGIYRMDPDGNNKQLIVDTPNCFIPTLFYTVTWSPNGQRIAYSCFYGPIYIADAVTGAVYGSFNIGAAHHPAWSPVDANKIAFVTDAHPVGSAAGVWIADVSNPASAILTSLSPENTAADNPAWSPDGQWIIYNMANLGGLRLISASGGNPYVLSTQEDFEASFSPDGTKIVFRRGRNDAGNLYIADISTNPPGLSNFMNLSALLPSGPSTGQFTLYDESRPDWDPPCVAEALFDSVHVLDAPNGLPKYNPPVYFPFDLDDGPLYRVKYRDSTSEWFYVLIAPDPPGPGWVTGNTTLISYTGDCDNLEIDPAYAPTATPTPTITPTPTPTFTPSPTPLPGRDVLPEAIPLHQKADQFGVPLPFEVFPLQLTSGVIWYQGYGPTGFAAANQGSYDEVQGIHSGLDFGKTIPNPADPTADVLNVCDGVIIDGRRSDTNGGSVPVDPNKVTLPGYLGLSVRCFAPGNPDNDPAEYRNLSNIIVTYNHLNTRDFTPPTGDDFTVVTAGWKIGTINASLDGRINHLHLEVFIRGKDDFNEETPAYDFRHNGAIRFNPLLMFTRQMAEPILQKFEMPNPGDPFPIYPIFPYYPYHKHVQGDNSEPLYLEGNGIHLYGLIEGDLDGTVAQGDFSTTDHIFWRVQTPTPVSIVEWPTGGLPVTPHTSMFGVRGASPHSLVEHLEEFYPLGSNYYLGDESLNCALPISSPLQPGTLTQCPPN